MRYEQLLNRNAHELADMMIAFHELNRYYQNLFTIYMDTEVIELFDSRVCRTIISVPFKNFPRLAGEFRQLMHDITHVRILGVVFSRGRKMKLTDYWAVKRIVSIYGPDDLYFFNNGLILDYIKNHGKIRKISKKQDLADCD